MPNYMKTFQILLLAALLMPFQLWAQDDNPVDFDSTRTKIQKWVETEQLISEKKADWQEGKGILEARIELLQSQVDDYKSRIEEAESEIAKSDEQKAELESKNQALKSATETLRTIIVGMEKKVKAEVLPRLPDVLGDKIRPLSQKLPDNPEETELSLSQRFQNVVGTLNEINKFNAAITTSTAIRELNGTEVEVKEIYLGLGQAYYVNNDGTMAGSGIPGAGGWDWQAVNQRAPEIMKIFQIIDGEGVAEFIPLPFEVK
jgi:predicted RNase H-like nuclease (RuvC/YqgF family)